MFFIRTGAAAALRAECRTASTAEARARAARLRRIKEDASRSPGDFRPSAISPGMLSCGRTGVAFVAVYSSRYNIAAMWPKRVFRRLFFCAAEFPASKNSQPKFQRLENAFVMLVQHAHNAAARRCAIRIKCAPDAHARAKPRAMRPGASPAVRRRWCKSRELIESFVNYPSYSALLMRCGEGRSADDIQAL